LTGLFCFHCCAVISAFSWC